MASYLNTNEIRVSLKQLVKQYVDECETCQELPDEFISLIKHNFLAKYVYYNKQKKQIEIGIDESDSPDTYPEIKVYKIPVNKAVKWLDGSFREQQNDLEFYGKLLNRNEIFNSSDVVLMSR
ncbi:hypothetical protein [Salegentibacter salegens]|uniref:Uncharacterized protein n=1 Tax=Salegentibacter salegens TaxID=143223 RepID=A0A1M7L2M7_9FLAO|nr:hypothetical protein [Salegentibacter salegens]PRX44836.1 hypothetical protein LY58_02015 [Salegentibacter salegens]SHM72129.1 hypothetical protein SAMN05878281_1706 [Salegentibacter salegens]